MPDCCDGLHNHAIDPTKTLTLRKQFEAEAYRRFRWLKGQVLKQIVELDGFGLKTNRGRFEFERSAEKVAAFMQWLEQMQRAGILGITQGNAIQSSAANAWTSVYIETAYQRGVTQAAQNVKKAGATVEQRWIEAAFNRPIHADRVGLAFIRTFDQLEGITRAVSQQISRTLAEGLAQGKGPLEIARNLNNRIDKIGITRARVLARTEVISAHAEATINAYEEAGIDGLQVRAEFSTAGDSRVCPQCAALEGTTYTREEARGVIPVHPNCRCTWLPVIEDATGIELR